MSSSIDTSPTNQKTTQTTTTGNETETGAVSNNPDATNRCVLIAIDRSKHSERALRWYASKMHSKEDRVAFVNVTEPPDLALGFGMAGAAVAEIYTKAVDETLEAAKRLAINVKSVCRSLGIEKIRFFERISHSPGQAIIEAAEEEQADLVILGSRGVGVIRRTFLGSVSDYVLHHSRRSAVLVVPADFHPTVESHLQQQQQQQQPRNGNKNSKGGDEDAVEEAASADDRKSDEALKE